MKKITNSILTKVIKPRPENSFKGTFGHILVIGGTKNYGGANILASTASVYSGTGLTTSLTDPINYNSIHTRTPEIMVGDMHDLNFTNKILPKMNTVLIGSGLGTDETALKILENVFNHILPTQTLVIDASAIDLVANHKLNLPITNIIFTPHQVEWERLSGIPVDEQNEELNSAAQLKLGATVVLKSHRTTVYFDKENIWQNTVGSPAMATGGMGDTLAGIIASFTAQFDDYNDSILAAVFMHSDIGDQLSKTNYVALPTNIIKNIPYYMNSVIN